MSATAMNSGVYRKCEVMIRHFMEIENPSPELTASFHEWLFSDLHCREKELVMRNLFYEALYDENVSANSLLNQPRNKVNK